MEKAYHWHRRLLCLRRERPRDRAAEQHDELTPFQLMELHPIPTSRKRTAEYPTLGSVSGHNENYATIGAKVCLGSTTAVIDALALRLLHPSQPTLAVRIGTHTLCQQRR
jgi:hypothetical protein